MPMEATSNIDRLAELVGIESGYWDLAGQWQSAPAGTKRALLVALGLDPEDEAGIAAAAGDLSWPGPDGQVPACPLPRELGVGHAWGVTCQAYGLRSIRNAGIGDFEDIAVLAEQLAAVGADFLGLSPLHALFPEDPARTSPYSPSSRRWLNELYVAVDTASRELDLPPVEMAGSDRLRAAELIDYPALAEAKGAALERLWHKFRTLHLNSAGTAAGDEFRVWQAEQGQDLERFCRFQMLARLVARERGRALPFQEWTPELRAPDTRDVEFLAQRERETIEWRAFLQWVADRQLARAHQRARDAGMRIGLYADLATGVVPDGAEAWADPDALVQGATMGAPPDPLGPFGQNWHVVAPSPLVLARTDAGPLRATLRSVMRRAGAMRIDHALGLMRLFLIPPDGSAAEGAYVRFPYRRLLRAVAEEAQTAGCVVIGEDLGTVPDGFREPMLEAGLLGYRVVWFERDWHGDQRFRPPEHFPAQAMATVSTHDLPTVRGWFAGQDISWRERLGLYPRPELVEADRVQRKNEAGLLLDRLRTLGLLGQGEDDEARTLALHRYLARSASAFAAVQLEDLGDEVEQPNLPGTVTGHPNWRRRYRYQVNEVATAPLASRILAIMAEERPR
jgi:4-alpha-glucanotransferase